MAAHRVTLIPGDGIGPEVTAAARTVLDATGVEIDWDVRHAGAAALERDGTSLPDATIESIRERGVALKGPTATTPGGSRSANVALRAALDLHTGIRPARSFPGVPAPFAGVDLVVMRMTGEDLYAGIEWEPGGDAAEAVRRLARETLGAEVAADAGLSLKPLSASAARRFGRAALSHAEATGRRRVTIAHKATVMRHTDGVFLSALRELAAAEHPDLEVDDVLVDTLCGDLVRRPERYGALLMPTMYGDLVSDLAAGLVGGPGLAPGANVGDEHAVFEAVHGSAPRIAGRGRANPMAAILSGAMLLRHLGEGAAADAVEGAVAATLAAGRTLTYDLSAGGDEASAASTASVAGAVAAALAGA